MKPLHIHGYIKHGVTVGDSRCKHLKPGQTAHRFIIQQTEARSDKHYLCLSCHESLVDELYHNKVTCVDCGCTLTRADAIGWSGYDTNPHEPQIFLCNECVGGVIHLNRIERDRHDFNAQFFAL